MHQGIFGERLGRCFRLGDPPTLLASTPGGHALAATELFHEEPGHSFAASMGHDDAYLIALQFRDLRHHELWLDGAPIRANPFRKGTSCFYDLNRDPVAHLAEPFHSMNFYMPCRALAEVSEELGGGRFNQLAHEPGEVIDDAVINSLGRSLLPVMHGELRANQLFVDHVLLALRGHLVSTYGHVCDGSQILRGGLAPWQQRKAVELIREHVGEGVALVALAAACRLSCSAFVRGFKKSFGMPPHQWLLQRRIDCAIECMRDHGLSLADVALSAGFADQSHFTRIFTGKMGVSPGAWRRTRVH